MLADYTDGSVRDVTRQAQFQSNEPSLAAVDEDGLVRTFDLAGEAAVMARYMGRSPSSGPSSRCHGCRTSRGRRRSSEFHRPNYIDELALASGRSSACVPSRL